MSGVQAGVFSRRRGRSLKTGQTTQYSGKLDDGYYQKGLAKSYQILTTGQYAGTSNIDLAHYTATAGQVAFVAATKTITDVGNGFAVIKTNDIITFTGTASNPGPFTVTIGNVAGTITVSEAVVDETPAGAVTVNKREAHSNNAVLDQNTGLMWSRYAVALMGAASDGKLPWYDATKIYDIFKYVIAANAASLGGYTDWRIPNDLELKSLCHMEQPNAAPDPTAFPSWPLSDYFWSSTTLPIDTASAVWSALSTTMILRTVPGLTPMAFMTPNSRMRSKTAISMAFRTRMAITTYTM